MKLKSLQNYKAYKHSIQTLAVRTVQFLFLSCFFLIGCDNAKCEKSEKLVLQNNSNRRILFSIREGFWDTVFTSQEPSNYLSSYMAPNSKSVKTNTLGYCWDKFMPYGKNTWMYVFDSDSIQNLSWDTVRLTNRGLLLRKMINRDTLNAMNWEISLP